MQAQLQILLEIQGERRRIQGVGTEVAKPQIFDGALGKVSEFVITYKLYVRIKIRGVVVEEQIQWILLYVEGGSANVQKENILEKLEAGALEYEIAGEFLADIKKFSREDKETVKIAELKRLEQGERIIEEFVQEFRRVIRKSRYEERLLVEEFKRGMNRTIYQRLMELEQQLSSIKQQYDRAITLDRNWRESRKKEERLRGQ